MNYCGAETNVHIGNQTPMTVSCWLEPDHPGRHRGQTLDSDDNPIPHYWSDK